MSGTVPIPYYSSRGTVYYTPTNPLAETLQTARFPYPPCRPRQRRPHSIHITRLPAGFIPFDLRPQPPQREPKKDSRFRIELRKLASRENAKRVLGSVFSPFSSNASTTPHTSSASASAASSTRSPSPETNRSSRTSFSAASADPSTIFSRRLATGTSLDDPVTAMPRPSIVEQHSSGSSGATFGQLRPAKNSSDMEKENLVCSGNGVACYINLVEPVIYVHGLDHDGTTRDSPSGANSTALLRGTLILKVTKSAKIKSVSLKFHGKAKTDWPEGIPPDKTQTVEAESLRTQVYPFFNAQYEGSEVGYGTHCTYDFDPSKSASSSVTNLSNATDTPHPSSRPRSSTLAFTSKEQKRLSLQSNQSRSFQKGDSPYGPTPQQKGYKVFHPGTYKYTFDQLIDNNSPETISLPMASVVWQLEVYVQRAGTFKPDLQGLKEIPVIRSPSEDSLELVEPISIARRWEDQLQYEIMISGKSFPLGSKIPIAFKLTPLAKVQVHKIKVYVSENIEYFTNNKRVTRKDVMKKHLILEKVAGKPLAKEYSGSEVKIYGAGKELDETQRQARRDAEMRQREFIARRNGTTVDPLPARVENLLGDVELGNEAYWGQTEMEMNVQLPTCEVMDKDRGKRLHPDCTWKCANVHHWIKIIMRISRQDADDPTGQKRRHFEISIDSPFTILNCRATQANLALPEYSGGPNKDPQSQQRACGCPNAAISNVSPRSSVQLEQTLDSMPADSQELVPGLARPPAAHLNNIAAVQRPIHFLRQPSFNPPEWSNDDPPPPMPTPPPGYDIVVGTPSSVDGLQDYFTRYAHAYEPNEDEDEDEDDTRAFTRGRVNVPHPRTPGGRIARSMDVEREFMLNSAEFNDVLRVGNIRSPDSNSASVSAT